MGVTGGIGSGKSTLCSIFSSQGIPVYDSDSQAKRLMSSDKVLRSEIIEAFGESSYSGEELNREYLASKVFSNTEALEQLNSIVHPRVKADFKRWCDSVDAEYVILECAILFEAKFDDCVDITVGVLAPESLRIERIISRDDSTKEQIQRRIENQMSDDQIHQLATYTVVNIDIDDLDDAAKMLDKKFLYEARKG